ncbi:phage tail-collar fiber domain-containing protein [Paenibacillus xanthanilyticus]|uniref:Phage tail protein n=1 Tax=Paenibacillus xanthanilyticus TaxID=1783531 RepID=A0ABV8KA75_9BACL
MAVFSTAFTNKGRALMAKVQTGAQLNFTRIALGDGTLSGGQQSSSFNALISQKYSVPISRLKTLTDGRASVGASFNNSAVTTAFTWREIGLFAMDLTEGEILYCYGNAGGTADVIAPGGTNPREIIMGLEIVIGNASNVTANINTSLVFVTTQELNDHRIAAVLDHPDGSVTDAKIGSRTVTDSTAPVATGTLLAHLNGLAYQIKAITGEGGWRTAASTTLKAIKTMLDAATSAATAGALLLRDAAGRAKVAAPVAGDDIARKDTVDNAVSSAISTHTGASDPHSQYAPKVSPALTGTPTAPTAAAGNNTTQIATTAFVEAVRVNLANSDALKAPLASPALTGTPTAPTPAAGTNSTQIANTAFVQAAIAALINAAPGALDTLDELAQAMGDDPNFAATITNALALKAPLASPALTGTPTAPTAASGTSTAQLATTAFIQSAIAERTNQDLRTTASPTFAAATIGGLNVKSEIDSLKSSVSSGKDAIASAIADMSGRTTSGSDTFANLATRIRQIPKSASASDILIGQTSYTVSTLKFRPEFVFVRASWVSGDYNYEYHYHGAGATGWEGLTRTVTQISMYKPGGTLQSVSATTQVYGAPHISVTNTGFQISSVPNPGSIVSLTWVAWDQNFGSDWTAL